MIREPKARHKRIKSRRARTLHGTKSTGLVVSGHVAFQAGRIIHTCLVTLGTLCSYVILHTHHSHVAVCEITLLLLSFVLLYITSLFFIVVCYVLSLFLSLSFSFVSLCVLFLPIVTSYSNLACCGYTCTYISGKSGSLYSPFSRPMLNASPLSRVTRRLIERSSNDIVTLHWIAVIVIAVVDSGRNLFIYL